MKTNWLDFASASPIIKQAIDSHSSGLARQIAKEQELRNVEVNIAELREKGTLLQDETIIPVRMIDTNIKREVPRYAAYLLGNRLISLLPDGGQYDPRVTEALEKRHHELLTYPGWLDAWFGVIDGACAHGVDYLEVVYDTSYPGHVAVEHIGPGNIILPAKISKVQQAPFILRCFQVTSEDLRKFAASFAFEGVDEIINSLPDLDNKGTTTELYKIFLRIDGIVHVAWYHEKYSAGYVKQPTPMTLGIRERVKSPPELDYLTGALIERPDTWVDAKLKQYPIVAYRYYITSEKELGKSRGRVYLDKYTQDAMTTGWSAFVNGLTRSSGLYASWNKPDGATKIALEHVKLKHGRILDKPVTFFVPPAPQPVMLSMLQALHSQNSQEAGQFNYAVTQKGGKTRPTATEVESAQSTTTELSSVGLAAFSEAVREVYSLTFRILQSLAEQDEIYLYGQRSLQPAPDGTIIEVLQNDHLVVKQPYLVKAAGDIDVVQRSQRIQKLMQFWPIVAGTPVAAKYLSKMLKIALPEDGEEFALLLEQGNPAPELISRLLSVINASVSPEEASTLPEQDQEQLAELLATAENYVAQANPAQQAPVAPGPTDQ